VYLPAVGVPSGTISEFKEAVVYDLYIYLQ